MQRIPISYILVEDSELSKRATIFHLLNEADVPLLRCFMTLLLLPADTGDLTAQQAPFVAATARVRRLPAFRKAQSRKEPPTAMWKDMVTSRLLMLMLADTIPIWLDKLALERDIGVLSSSGRVVESLRTKPHVHIGLLKGFDDLREAYRVIREMLATVAADGRFEPEVVSASASLALTDLFVNRPRLDFIPPVPLPQPGEGRPAAYLINRLSNNVDEPSLAGKASENSLSVLPQMLNWIKHACIALAVLEVGEELPKQVLVEKSALEASHSILTRPGEDSRTRLDTLLELGRQLANEGWPKRPFFAIPVPRLDLVRGKVPGTLIPDTDHVKNARAGLRAVTDFLEGKERTVFGTKKDKQAYSNARLTLDTEQRLIACEAAWLAGLCGAVPVQLHPLPGQLYNVLRDLNSAFESNSRKIPQMFRGVELALATLLPAGLLEYLARGDSPVIFFSDLPFEWTLVENWPVCLTRRVSRIPIGLSHWDVLSAALEYPAEIDVSKPEKVLVIDLIEAHDVIRSYSTAFFAASEANAQRYTYCSPKNAAEFREVLSHAMPDIVVLDSHGNYDQRSDELSIRLGDVWVALDDLLAWSRVPPVWVLSACHTSVTGAIQGSFVRQLLARGAVCVIATLNRVDAFTASMFLGRLLTDIYNPVVRGSYETLGDAFFVTQYITALIYDPLLPLFRQAEANAELREPLAAVLSEFFSWYHGRNLDVRKHRDEIAWFVGESLARHGLTPLYVGALQAGRVTPETLLFTAFGAPGHVTLKG